MLDQNYLLPLAQDHCKLNRQNQGFKKFKLTETQRYIFLCNFHSNILVDYYYTSQMQREPKQSAQDLSFAGATYKDIQK
jgi:hypothetical protein